MVAHDMKNGLFANDLNYAAKSSKEYLTFWDVWLFFRRNLVFVAVCAAIGIAVGVVYLNNTEPQYLAVSRVVMDPGQAKIASQDEASGTIIIESAEIASQVEIVKSESVASTVVRELNLFEDPEILTSTSWRSVVRKWISFAGITLGLMKPADDSVLDSEDRLIRRTMAGFLSRVTARRVGQSYVLEIGYASINPEHAAVVANKIAQTYIRTGMAERRDAARRGGEWLEERLIEIGQRARESQLAVEQYRATKGLTSVGAATSLDHQQLVETSSQLLAARAETASQLARLEIIRRLLAGELPDSELDDSLVNASIMNLRDELRLARTNYDSIKQRYEPENEAVSAAKEKVEKLQAELQNEYLRLENAYRSSLEVARAKERILTSGLSDLREQGEDNNLARVDLAELESRASTYRRMYESVLQQLINALQVQSFPLGTARIVTAATPPLSKTSPKTSLILPFSMVLGLGVGFLIVGWREGMDRRLGSGSRLARELGISILGKVPLRSSAGMWKRLTDDADFPQKFSALGAVLESPYSMFSESLRDIKFSIDAANPSSNTVVVGIASEGQGDGKTTISTNLAQLYFNEGVDVVLVDADFQDGVLTELACDPTNADKLGLARLAQKHSEECVEDETPDNGVSVELAVPASTMLPVATLKDIGDFSNIHDHRKLYWHLPALQTRLSELRSKYSVVLVDMSSFSTSADARSVCGMVDGVIIVVGDPRRTTLDSLSESLSRFGDKQINLLGVVLNRAGKETTRGNSRPSEVARN